MKKLLSGAVFVLIASCALALGNVAVAAPVPQVTICHFPPGNPANVQVITVGQPAVAAHVANHNDAVCPAGDSNCCFGGNNPSLCTKFQTDVNNCGRCGNVCNLPNAASACAGGACTVLSCRPGFGNCDGNAANGCETPLNTVANCGACGTACATGASCTSGTCACPAGDTVCNGACVNESADNNNCGTCGKACTAGATCTDGTCVTPCVAGTTLCGGVCVNENTDPNNCGGCGTTCPNADTCVGAVCTPPAVAASCLPTSSLSVLIQGTSATAYVPLGSWTEATTGVKVVPLEPAVGPSTLVATALPVNSCSSNGVTGLTVCTGNSNDMYVINGTTLSSLLTAGGTAPQFFSGGPCTTCGVSTDASTGLAWIAEGISTGGGALQSLDPASSVFGAPVGLFGEQTSENVSVDPVRHLVLSAAETGNFQIINTTTSAVYNNSAGPVPLTLDSTAEDCSTGVAVAPGEFSQSVFMANLSAAIYTPGSPGTWSAPTAVQDFSPDFINLSAGASGIAVAPGSHLVMIAGEFGGTGFGVIKLPSSISTVGTPAAVDWVAANVPNDPTAAPWNMGLDPHTVTAYVSPVSGKAIGLMTNDGRSFLAVVDMQALLGALRTPGTHTVDPSVNLVTSGIVTFIAE